MARTGRPAHAVIYRYHGVIYFLPDDDNETKSRNGILWKLSSTNLSAHTTVPFSSFIIPLIIYRAVASLECQEYDVDTIISFRNAA